MLLPEVHGCYFIRSHTLLLTWAILEAGFAAITNIPVQHESGFMWAIAKSTSDWLVKRNSL
jgi:hypothetical protein